MLWDTHKQGNGTRVHTVYCTKPYDEVCGIGGAILNYKLLTKLVAIHMVQRSYMCHIYRKPEFLIRQPEID